jgi:tRNA1(Val) A37 N6-methylase TrmN6
METLAQAQQSAAQRYFPRGLYQPPGSFRFSIDALLLASFAGQCSFPSAGSDALNLLDLGCGCGVVAFALMLRNPHFMALGLDMQEELVQAARVNAQKLDFGHRYQAVQINLESVQTKEDYLQLCAGQINNPAKAQHLVTANPPYRLPGSGRLPGSMSRSQALFGGELNLKAFARVAALTLSATGFFCLIFPFARREALFLRLEEYGLNPVRELRIYSKAGIKNDASPTFTLVASQRQKEPQFTSEQLVLYCGSGSDTVLTDEALSFCPFLACNL